ncbi:hypothetical protein L1049_000790 [Liquidambar formosana]|uniref:Uncharacterized protein n=1 Tax=Liquidambar formosana TaxID=63359 RepID=A0AAP0R3D6_LIQFO
MRTPLATPMVSMNLKGCLPMVSLHSPEPPPPREPLSEESMLVEKTSEYSPEELMLAEKMPEYSPEELMLAEKMLEYSPELKPELQPEMQAMSEKSSGLKPEGPHQQMD